VVFGRQIKTIEATALGLAFALPLSALPLSSALAFTATLAFAFALGLAGLELHGGGVRLRIIG
jgi:hypothetical protein